MNPLLLPYIANIVLLVPVALGSLFGLYPVSRAHFPESAGWRTLTGSLWTAILIASVLGLFQPVLFCPVLLLQVIYKTLWLLVYVAPRIAKADRRSEIDWGTSTTFLLVVVLYPLVIPWHYLFGWMAM
ncbi:MAG TPA: hypothetical protein VKF42_00755 [Chitinivibrionales bacterium]|jgi:hypothetical protein|nr:hypothetical protein [Chitinivibrionales bacterium]